TDRIRLLEYLAIEAAGMQHQGGREPADAATDNDRFHALRLTQHTTHPEPLSGPPIMSAAKRSAQGSLDVMVTAGRGRSRGAACRPQVQVSPWRPAPQSAAAPSPWPRVAGGRPARSQTPWCLRSAGRAAGRP